MDIPAAFTSAGPPDYIEVGASAADARERQRH